LHGLDRARTDIEADDRLGLFQAETKHRTPRRDGKLARAERQGGCQGGVPAKNAGFRPEHQILRSSTWLKFPDRLRNRARITKSGIAPVCPIPAERRHPIGLLIGPSAYPLEVRLDSAQKGPYDLGLPLLGPARLYEPGWALPHTVFHAGFLA